MTKYEYKTVNMYLSPIESEVSQVAIEDKCNELGQDGWELIDCKIYNINYVMLIFKK